MHGREESRLNLACRSAWGHPHPEFVPEHPTRTPPPTHKHTIDTSQYTYRCDQCVSNVCSTTASRHRPAVPQVCVCLDVSPSRPHLPSNPTHTLKPTSPPTDGSWQAGQGLPCLNTTTPPNNSHRRPPIVHKEGRPYSCGTSCNSSALSDLVCLLLPGAAPPSQPPPNKQQQCLSCLCNPAPGMPLAPQNCMHGKWVMSNDNT